MKEYDIVKIIRKDIANLKDPFGRIIYIDGYLFTIETLDHLREINLYDGEFRLITKKERTLLRLRNI